MSYGVLHEMQAELSSQNMSKAVSSFVRLTYGNTNVMIGSRRSWTACV